jgi:uncharacterized damage-inducible protein DinB
MTEAQFLAGMMGHSHEFTQRHIQMLQETDLHKRFSAEGKELNSAYWLFAHMVVSQNWLILRGTGGPFQKFSWAKLFNIGTTPPPQEECPSFEVVIKKMEEIQRLSLDHVASLDEAALAAPHNAMMHLPGGNTVADIIKHHIRHESMHNGQLSWLCKLHGLKTI